MEWEKATIGPFEGVWVHCTCQTAALHLKKLDDRSIPMVYLGVEEGSKAHRLFDPQTKRIGVSRDVVFEETKAWEWKSDYTEGSDFVVVETVESNT